jgi:hypothetical protein
MPHPGFTVDDQLLVPREHLEDLEDLSSAVSAQAVNVQLVLAQPVSVLVEQVASRELHPVVPPQPLFQQPLLPLFAVLLHPHRYFKPEQCRYSILTIKNIDI